VRARGVHCLVQMSLKRRAAPFPFSLCPVEVFPFPFLGMAFPFSLEIKSDPPPLPPTFYPALAGLMDIPPGPMASELQGMTTAGHVLSWGLRVAKESTRAILQPRPTSS